jgi:hypothetical protein
MSVTTQKGPISIALSTIIKQKGSCSCISCAVCKAALSPIEKLCCPVIDIRTPTKQQAKLLQLATERLAEIEKEGSKKNSLTGISDDEKQIILNQEY